MGLQLPFFKKEQIKNFDGKEGSRAYVIIKGIVYDVSDEKTWSSQQHFGLTPGKDLTEDFEKCHPDITLLKQLKKVGYIKDE